VLWKHGQLDAAIAEYQTALHLDPTYVLAHANLAEAMAELREAIRLYAAQGLKQRAQQLDAVLQNWNKQN
jgi:hypothetical protein